MDYFNNLQCNPVEITIKHDIDMHFSELFYTNIFLALCALILACLGICYRSKCVKINLCWGGIQIHRQISAELELDENPDIELPETDFTIPHGDSSEHSRH